MKKNNKIGLFVVLMLLGVCNVQSGSNAVLAKTDGFIITADEQKPAEVIKANKDTLESAKSFMDKKDYNSAIEYLTAYINGKPKKYEAYKLRGECYYAMRQYELARDDFQTAVELKTDDDRFATGAKIVSAVVLGADKEEQKQNTELGNLYGQLMYAQKALNDPAYEDTYKKAFEYNSHIYLPQPKKEEVAKINCPQKYGKELDPSGIDLDIKNIIENIESGDYHEAAYKVSKVTSELPDYYYGYYLTGVVMSGLEQEKDAVPAFEKAISLNPNDFESMASLGQLYYSEAEKYLSANYANKSLENFEKALKLNPNCYIYHFYMGLNNLLLSKNAVAISEFDKALSMNSKDYNSMYYKLIAQYLKSDYSGVVSGTDAMLNRRVSNSSSVLYLRALANHKLGKEDDALADIDKVFAAQNDIYNADIKHISAKEQTLPAYLYLLKSQILKAKGEDNKQELAKAYENPVIKSMSKPLYSEVNISSVDFENQLDYIRTAFVDNKIMMKFLGSEYQVSNVGLKNNAIKTETSDALSEEPSNLARALASGLLLDEDQDDETPTISMKQTTAPEETLSQNNSPSVAEMLAANSMPTSSEKADVTLLERNGESESEKKSPSEFTISYSDDVVLPETIKSEPEEKSPSEFTISHSDDVVLSETIKSEPEKKSPSEFTISHSDDVVLSETIKSEPEKKSPSEFTISYSDDVVLPEIAKNNALKDKNSVIVMADDINDVMNEEPEPKKEDIKAEKPNIKISEPEIVAEIPVQKTEQNVSKVEDELAFTKTVMTAPVQKESEDFNITYDEPTPTISLYNAQPGDSADVEIIEISEGEPVKNPFENMDEPVQVSEKLQEIMPVLSTPISSVSKPVKYLSTSETSSEEPVKSVAKEIKDTPDFKISYDEPKKPVLREPAKTFEKDEETTIGNVAYTLEDGAQKSEQFQNSAVQVLNEIEHKNQKIENNIAQIQDEKSKIFEEPKVEVETDVSKLVESHFGGSAPDVISSINGIEDKVEEVKEIKKEPSKVVEKFADVNLNEFNIQKPALQIKDNDEIVVFEPSNFIEKANEKLAEDNFGIKNTTKEITDNFAQIQKQAKQYIESVQDVEQQLVADNLQNVDVPERTISSKDKVAKIEKEPELIMPEVVVSEKPAKVVNDAVEKTAIKTVEKVQTVVPTVRADKYIITNEEPKDAVSAQKLSDTEEISEAQKVLSDFENKTRTASNTIAENITDSSKEQKLWDFLSQEEIPEQPVQKAGQKEQTLEEFLSDDFDEAAVSKAKAKKMRKLNKRSKKEAQVASIVQNTLVGDTVNSQDFAQAAEVKPKKSWFKRKKVENVEKTVSETADKAEKKTISIKNLFKKNKSKVENEVDTAVSKPKRSWFKFKKSASDELSAADNAVKKEKKRINWFWKKNKTDAENVVKVKKEKVKKVKTETDKKSFSLKNLFKRNKVE